MNPNKTKFWFLVAWLSSLLLGALVYISGLPGGFVFDDISNITENPGINLQTMSFRALWQAAWSAPVGILMRPISSLSFALDAYFFGIIPAPFKITNICIHVLVGALLWFLAREILRAYRASFPRHLNDNSIAWLSLATSTLWLVHPINLTSVLYVVQRDNSLAALFTVAAILSYMVGRRSLGWHGRIYVWLLTPLCTAIGILCKENAALVPVFILVIEYTLLGFRNPAGNGSREARWFLIVFLLIPMLGLGVYTAINPGLFFSTYSGRNFTMYQRLLSEGRALVDYLRWSIAPDLRQLGLFHDDMDPSLDLLHPGSTLPCLVVVAALVVAGITLRKKLPLISFGILWFFAGQLMESTILPLELVFEHRNYLPVFGIILSCVGTMYPLAAEHGRTTLAKVLLVVCVVLLALTTMMRALDWQTPLTFARSEAKHHPRSARALSELEWAYLNYVVATKDTRVIPLVLDAAERSKAADPGNLNQEIGLIYMYSKLNDAAQVMRHLQISADEAMTAQPSASLQLALQTLLPIDKKGDKPLHEAISLVFKRAEQNPRLTSYICYGADIWNTDGVLQENFGDIPAALTAMHKATTLCPAAVRIRTNFAGVLLDYNDPKDAGPQLEALRDVDDPRYLPEILRLRRQYAQEMSGSGENNAPKSSSDGNPR